jgi:hypothetical protein
LLDARLQRDCRVHRGERSTKIVEAVGAILRARLPLNRGTLNVQLAAMVRPLEDVTTKTIDQYIAARRAETITKSKAEGQNENRVGGFGRLRSSKGFASK